MQKKIFCLSICFALFLVHLHAHINRSRVTDECVSPTPPCTLPAPANLQYYQPDPYSFTFTWDTVAGASGYRTVLINLSTNSQWVNSTPNPHATYAVPPGDTCLFIVAAECSPGQTSPFTAQVGVRGGIIITELIAEMPGCTPTNKIFEGVAGTSFNFNWSNGQSYFIELKSTNTPSLVYEFHYLPNGHFQFRGVSSNSYFSQLYGQSIFSPIYLPAPTNPNDVVFSSNMKVTYQNPALEGYVAFPLVNELYYFANPGGTPPAFSTIKIYSSCGSGGDGRGLSGASGDPSPGDGRVEDREWLSGVRPVNPFVTDLPLLFQGYPESPLTARLYDSQGQEALKTAIQAADVSENLYLLRTDGLLPGLYYLRLETAQGVFRVHKVVKM